MKERIVHVVLRDYHDDYSYQENLLSQKHVELGYEVMVITTQRYSDKNKRKAFHEVGDFTNKRGVIVSVLPCKARNNFTGIFMDQSIGLYEKLCEFSPNYIFVHNFAYHDIRYIVKYAHQYPDVKVYADCHTDYYNSSYDTFYGKAKALFAKREGHILNKVTIKFWGTTPWRVEFLRDVYKLPIDKTDLLVLGADEQIIKKIDRESNRIIIREKYGIPSNAFLIITGGKLDKRKQQNLLMEAVEKMLDDDIWLLAFGTPSDDMITVFQRFEKQKNIIMPGWVSPDDVYPLFMAADLAFFPGTHSVLWEQSVACSIPLVVRHWHGMEHVNVNGNALLLDEITVDSITKVIKELNYTDQYYKMLSSAEMCAPSFYLRQIALKAIGL